jgi:hypothetical protein
VFSSEKGADLNVLEGFVDGTSDPLSSSENKSRFSSLLLSSDSASTPESLSLSTTGFALSHDDEQRPSRKRSWKRTFA